MIRNLPLLLVLNFFFAIGLGIADYVTGDLSLLIFYFVPIATTTWYVGRRAGIAISFLCAAEILTTDVIIQMSRGSFPTIRIWNSVIEAAFLLVASHILHLLKAELEKNRSRAQELEIANAELDAFNYSVAHDLRSPLTWIGGYSQLLVKRYGKIFDEQHREFLLRISEGTLTMQHLIDALLDFARIGRCELRRERVDLSLVAEKVARELILSEPGRHVRFEIEPGIAVDGDTYLLSVVLRNLLGNAWKYSAQRDDAVIEFGQTEKGGRRVCFVRDNGIGFSRDDAKDIFGPFKRLDTSEDYSGHGIGLATVQRIIQRHGGQIWAEGEPDRGAIFYFSL